MRYTVTPGESVGALRFGMSREDVHTRLGSPDEPDEGADAPEVDDGECEDEWEDDGLAVRYDASGAVVEVTLFPPSSASVQGAHLLGEHDGDPLEALSAVDPECTEDEGVVVSGALGIVYAEEDGDVELIVLAPGRLDALAARAAADVDSDTGDGDTGDADTGDADDGSGEDDA